MMQGNLEGKGREKRKMVFNVSSNPNRSVIPWKQTWRHAEEKLLSFLSAWVVALHWITLVPHPYAKMHDTDTLMSKREEQGYTLTHLYSCSLLQFLYFSMVEEWVRSWGTICHWGVCDWQLYRSCAEMESGVVMEDQALVAWPFFLPGNSCDKRTGWTT